MSVGRHRCYQHEWDASYDEITAWGVAAEGRDHVHLWCRALTHHNIAFERLSHTKHPEGFWICAWKITMLDTHWAAMWHTESQSPMECQQALCFSYQYRTISSTPEKTQHKNWSGAGLKVCSYFSLTEQVKARWQRASLGWIQETQGVLKHDVDSCTYLSTGSPLYKFCNQKLFAGAMETKMGTCHKPH